MSFYFHQLPFSDQNTIHFSDYHILGAGLDVGLLQAYASAFDCSIIISFLSAVFTAILL